LAHFRALQAYLNRCKETTNPAPCQPQFAPQIKTVPGCLPKHASTRPANFPACAHLKPGFNSTTCYIDSYTGVIFLI
jgi:hypothetical protein